jgi:ABC-type glycerol-3-phosphate transport system substrate-binding protein
MKKFIFGFIGMFAAAMMMTACGNGSTAADETASDSTVVVTDSVSTDSVVTPVDSAVVELECED